MVKLYKESVEDRIKENITIGGQEWDSPSKAEVSSSSAVQEGKCKLNINLTKKSKRLFNALGVVLHGKVRGKLRFEQGRPGGSGILIYLKRRVCNLYPNFPLKFMPNAKLWKNEVYFVPIKVPILAAKYHILNLKSPCIPYTQKYWLTLIETGKMHTSIQLLQTQK